MTIHVSLPEELENRVHEQVNTGMYGSASEVVREALRNFFAQGKQDNLSPAEITWIRTTMKPRLDAVLAGTAELMDADSFLDNHINRLSE